MPFPTSPAATRQILDRLAAPRFFDARTLLVDFTTTERTARRVLPPGFTPVDGHRCWARIGTWNSNCVGTFSGATIAIEAQFGDHVGFLALAMYMDSEPAILFGRELYGEPKRSAVSSLHATADGWSAHIERHGTRILELTGQRQDEVPPANVSGVGMNIKWTFAPDGSGLLGDAVVTRSDVAGEFTHITRGAGTLTLRSTPHDPLGDFEVEEVTGATYSEGGFQPRARAIGTIPGADFLPFALARVDDYSRLTGSDVAVRRCTEREG